MTFRASSQVAACGCGLLVRQLVEPTKALPLNLYLQDTDSMQGVQLITCNPPIHVKTQSKHSHFQTHAFAVLFWIIIFSPPSRISSSHLWRLDDYHSSTACNPTLLHKTVCDKYTERGDAAMINQVQPESLFRTRNKIMQTWATRWEAL